MSNTQQSSLPGNILLYLVIADLIIILCALLARHLFDLPPIKAFYPFFYGAQAALLIAGLAILQLCYAAVKKKQALLKPAFIAILLGLSPVCLSLVSVGISGFKAPMIHDITTDMEDPPQFGILSSMRTADENSLEYAGEEVASLQRDFYPEVKALQTRLTQQTAFQNAAETARKLGWEMVVEDESSGIIEAYETSKIFGFVDDVVIRVKSTPEGSRVDLRSVSRVGMSDLGMNAARINKFCEMFLSKS